jgi:DNA-binding transcriptional MerR regulator
MGARRLVGILLNLIAATEFIITRMGIPARGMRIGEVADRTGLTAQAIRYYEREGLLPQPVRAHTGYRLYGAEVLGRLGFIKQARRLGLSLSEIRQILQMSQAGRAPCCKVRELLAGKLEELDRTIAELSRFREELRRFLEAIARMPDQADTSRQICSLIEMAPNTSPSPAPMGRLRTGVDRGKRSRTASMVLPVTDRRKLPTPVAGRRGRT